MKAKELRELTKISYHQVAVNGRDAARIYHAVVELDGQALMWKKRALDLGWTEDTVIAKEPESAPDQETQ